MSNIDQLFKAKLSDSSSTPPKEIWNGIEGAIPKRLFFRFRYEHMNVYYASMIGLCFLFSGTSLFYTLKDKTSDAEQDSVLVSSEDSLSTEANNNSSLNNTVQQNNKVNKKRSFSFSQEDGLNKQDALLPIGLNSNADSLNKTESAIDIDTTKNSLFTPLLNNQETKPKVKKEKKVVYIMDYDTVVNYDTLRTKRKKK